MKYGKNKDHDPLPQFNLLLVFGEKSSLSFVKAVIDRESSSMRDWSHYNENHELFIHSETIKWDYEQERPYKGDVLKDDRRMYLHLYYNPAKAVDRTRDVVEKAFGNLKERLNCRRMLVSSDSSLEGKLFVQFIALIYVSYIRKRMQDKDLYRKYTMHGLLDELDVIECFRQPGKDLYIGEVLSRQKQIYLDMDVPEPSNITSLCIDLGM